MKHTNKLCVAILVAFLAVVQVGCQTSGGKSCCLFKKNDVDAVDARGQVSDSQRNLTDPPAPEVPNTNRPIEAAWHETPLPSNTLGDGSSNALALNQNGDPRYVGNTANAESANASLPFNSDVVPEREPVGAPQAQYRSVAPSQNQETASKPLEFAPTTQDYSAQLPPELAAAASLFGFGDPSPNFETTLPSDAPLPPEMAPKTPEKRSDKIEPSQPPVESNGDVHSSAYSPAESALRGQLAIDAAALSREPVTLKDRAVVRRVEETSAAGYASQSGGLRPSNAFPGQYIGGVVNGSGENATVIERGGVNGTSVLAAPRTTAPQLRPSTAFPGQYIGGVVDGSGARAVLK